MSGSTPSSPLTRPVVVYDGECSYCLHQIKRMRTLDGDGSFEYQPRQAAGLASRFPQLAGGDFNSGMRLIHRDGSLSVGADAVYEISRRLRWVKYLAWMYRLPMAGALARWVYGWIAANRYRLAGECAEDCETGPAETGR